MLFRLTGSLNQPLGQPIFFSIYFPLIIPPYDVVVSISIEILLNLQNKILLNINFDYNPHCKHHVHLIYFHGFQLLVQLPYIIEITSFVSTNRIHFLYLRPSTAIKANSCATKTKGSITSHSPYFLKIADVFNLVKSTILFIFKCCGVLTSASDKDKLFCLNIF